MKAIALTADRYKSLRRVRVELRELNVLIGANGAGKSTVLDALRFFAEAARSRDFVVPIRSRGGLSQMAWMGEPATNVVLAVTFEADTRQFEWRVELQAKEQATAIHETLERKSASRNEVLMDATNGVGFWRSGSGETRQTPMSLPSPTDCALAAASADESFEGREVLAAVKLWQFFDPSPVLLRQPSLERDRDLGLDASGRNLANVLRTLLRNEPARFHQIAAATSSIVGGRMEMEFPESDDGGALSFLAKEPNLRSLVPPMAVSNGILRIIALMTAIYGADEPSLIGIEEPEIHLHPAAIVALAEHLREAVTRMQILITTHSPHLLGGLAQPEDICMVVHGPNGTEVTREPNPQGVRSALDKSGFSLSEFYESQGFGA